MRRCFVWSLIGAVSLLAAPQLIAAQGLVPCGQTPANPCQLCHFFQLAHNILEFILVVLAPILGAFLFAWGGFVWLTAMGAPARVRQGQQIILAAVIGILIVYGAWVFINLLLQVLGAATYSGTGGWGRWWEIQC